MSLRLDIDESTAVAAIGVLTHMLSLDLLESEECVEVCELIFIESRPISHAAGHFAINYLFSSDFMDRARQKAVPAGTCKLVVAWHEWGLIPSPSLQARRNLVMVRSS